MIIILRINGVYEVLESCFLAFDTLSIKNIKAVRSLAKVILNYSLAIELFIETYLCLPR